jgi:hypothetical protein
MTAKDRQLSMVLTVLKFQVVASWLTSHSLNKAVLVQVAVASRRRHLAQAAVAEAVAVTAAEAAVAAEEAVDTAAAAAAEEAAAVADSTEEIINFNFFPIQAWHLCQAFFCPPDNHGRPECSNLAGIFITPFIPFIVYGRCI